MSKPILQALLLADQVYQDKTTNKFVIAGTFHNLHIRKKPPGDTAKPTEESGGAAGGLRKMDLSQTWSIGSPFAYISLTDVRGQVPLELRYVDLRDDITILSFPFTIQGKDPLDTIEVMVRLPTLPCPHPGAYALELLSDNEVLGSHRVIVLEGPTNPGSVEENK